MKKYFLLLIILSNILWSCQKVIELKLDNASPQIVIQGNIYDQPGPFTIKISKTVDFDQSNKYPAVNGALVIISDDHGTTDTLKETSSGFYSTSKIQGISGYTYNLSVKVEDALYKASSSMPVPVKIDSVYAENSFMGNKQLSVTFMDRANVENYYRIVEFVNTKQIEEFNVVSDDLYKGKKVTYKIISMSSNNDNKLDAGDYIVIWLEAIDKGVYEYFRTAGRDGSQSATPSNPASNITNGALGYFNACSVTKKAISIMN